LPLPCERTLSFAGRLDASEAAALRRALADMPAEPSADG
jgi:hypothetical protein